MNDTYQGKENIVELRAGGLHEDSRPVLVNLYRLALGGGGVAWGRGGNKRPNLQGLPFSVMKILPPCLISSHPPNITEQKRYTTHII